MKARSVTLLALAEVMTMSLWLLSAAILPDLVAEGGLGPGRAAALSSAVQIGFVLGALALAVHGTADRFDPRRVLLASALVAAAANAALLVTPIGGAAQIGLRALTGACLAGVYPVGMKIVVGWGTRDRGLLVGSPRRRADNRHGPAASACLLRRRGLAGDGRSRLGAGGGGRVSRLSAPGSARTTPAPPASTPARWSSPGPTGGCASPSPAISAICGSSTPSGPGSAPPRPPPSQRPSARPPRRAAGLVAFAAIALGGLLCVPAGRIADRIGKARVARGAMLASGAAGLATAASFGGPWQVTAVLILLWGAAVIPDSAQFSALVADAAPPERAGSLMTFQTALGFTLTFFTVQAVPALAASLGWPATLALMALGPAFGVEAMRRLIRLGRDSGG